MTSSAREQQRVITTAVIGTVLVFAYAAFALLQMLWLNPLAAVPDVPMEQIRLDVAAAGESMSAPLVIGFMSLGPVAAVVALAKVVFRPDTGMTDILVFYLSLLVFGAAAYFWASFGPGMAMADTYFITGGDHSPWAQALYLVSALALLALIALAVASIRSSRRRLRNHSVLMPTDRRLEA